jgi:tight adherence protein B
MNLVLTFVIFILVFIFIAAGIVVFGAARMISSGGTELNDRIEIYARLPERMIQGRMGFNPDRFLRLRLRVNNMLSIFASRDLYQQLNSANWPITVSEFVLFRFVGSIFGFLLGWLIAQSIFPGIGVAILVYFVPTTMLRSSINRRRIQFERQLVDILVLITGAVRAGYSLLQALDLVVEEASEPAADEFRRVTREVSLGLSLNEALQNLTDRMDNDDLYLVATAININAQVGGNLGTMLEAVTETIRERMRLFGEVRVMTTHQRFTGYMLTVLPFIIAAVLFVLNPSYMNRLFDFLCIPITAIVLIIIGNLSIRQLMKIKV